MKLAVEFNDKSKSGIRKSFVFSVAKKTFEKIEGDFLDDKKINISVAMVDEEEMRKLNRTYRRKNSVTDVLSFAEYKNLEELKRAGDKSVFLGEVVLCYNYIEKYSQEKKEDVKIELAKVMSHGLLHLLGFRHGKKMFEIQNAAAGDIK